MKVLIITNIPNPYRIPLFNELHEQCSRNGMVLKVIFAAETYSRRKFVLDLNDCKFDYSFLGSTQHSFGNSERTTFAYGNLGEVLNAEKPDRIIVSGFSLATLKVWWYTRLKRAQFLIWSGSVGMEGKGWPILRKAQRRVLMAFTAAFVVYGERAKKYLLNSGVKADKIYKGLNTVDTAFFSQQTRILKEKREKEPNKKQLSYVGYLSKRKNVSQLLDCLRLLADKRQDFVLNLIGDGDDKVALEEKVKELRLGEFVRFVGFKQKEELPEYYASTDVFLFQTDFDIWGLVLNEAMSAGLPCIVSPNAGAADDLIIDGQTGFVIDYNEKEKIVTKIIELFDDENLRSRVGNAASKFIEEKASLKVSAQGFVEAVKSTLKNK